MNNFLPKNNLSVHEVYAPLVAYRVHTYFEQPQNIIFCPPSPVKQTAKHPLVSPFLRGTEGGFWGEIGLQSPPRLVITSYFTAMRSIIKDTETKPKRKPALAGTEPFVFDGTLEESGLPADERISAIAELVVRFVFL